MSLDLVETLQRLIRTPSVNPMGRELSEPNQGESRVTDLLVEICEQHGWPWMRQPVHPGRDNLIAIVDGRPGPMDGGELLLWDVHQDTVPVDGMTVDPFDGEIRDGRVYGRGACDVKGSMAAMLGALSRVSERSEPSPNPSLKGRGIRQGRPTIVLVCTANEECGFTGAKAIGREFQGTELAQFFPQPPDAAIVAEPTGLNVVVAHQGVVRWRCHSIGRAAHTSRPDAGINAIYGMAQIIRVVEQFHATLSATAPNHPLCGRPSVCVSTIHGGVGINTVPERATIEIDRRLGPTETPEAAWKELVRYIAEHVDVGSCTVEHDPPFMQSLGLSDAKNRHVAERLASVTREHGRASQLIGVPFGTDAAAFSAVEVPTVVFGPGSIDQAHTADEFIEIEELELATEIFYRVAMEGLRD